MCGKFQAPLRLLLIIFKDIYMISTLKTVFVMHFYVKYQFKRVSLMEKMPVHVLRSHIAGHIVKMGVCQSAEFGRISKIFNNFLYEIQIERESVL